ncbi:MAG: hypothetical protein WEB53_06990 [Akkermansiaceae bacterium]
MKLHSPCGGIMITRFFIGLCSLLSVSAQETIPTGRLDVDRTLARNGDPLPATNGTFWLGHVKNQPKSHLSSDQTTVQIGNREILVRIELGQTDPKHPGLDLQDLAVLVTFE